MDSLCVKREYIDYADMLMELLGMGWMAESGAYGVSLCIL